MNKLSRKQHQLYILFPFFSLLLALAVVAYLTGDETPPPATAVSRPTATATLLPGQTPPTATPIATAIPGTPSTPIPPTATPTLPANAEITLFGPPPDGRFFTNQTIPFFWDWPLPLTEEQGFIVVVTLADETLQIGVVDEPNFGSQYRLSGNLVGIVSGNTAVSATWEVQLIHTPTNTILRRSPKRSITLMPNQ